MRFGKTGRFFRFMFYPVCLLGLVMLLNMSANFQKVDDLCTKRAECLYYCQTDNFPLLSCQEKEHSITYNNNKYEKFFYYPKPTLAGLTEQQKIESKKMFKECHALVDENPDYPFSKKEPKR